MSSERALAGACWFVEITIARHDRLSAQIRKEQRGGREAAVRVHAGQSAG